MNLPQTPKENRAGKASERGWQEQAGGDGRAGFAQLGPRRLLLPPTHLQPACRTDPSSFPVSLASRLLREGCFSFHLFCIFPFLLTNIFFVNLILVFI